MLTQIKRRLNPTAFTRSGFVIAAHNTEHLENTGYIAVES
jgi:hypothetical protein